ncbi:GNAT family N-acetyltransferase [Rhodobacter sp. Har01]|uniref:GNAT family N-acetyltransferase n=1 Tax=Rhodobacter sp. Har01 TaxID=2883999 RepID=UPI001D06013A|nr:GNAT family N-acetyltransferase [Rhodobacter sp. Har01]MCB6179204.1 GNAT family N-acetyltransferase [Rhodobacter sp. Har01]
MPIRELSPQEAPLVARFYRDAPDYWLFAEGAVDPDRQAAEFFTDCPPGCDPAASARLGLFLQGRLSGVAELSFGYPGPQDAYLGLMLLGPWAQGAGHGRAFLAHVEGLARALGAPMLYLAVLEANPRGRAFWDREGFRPTGQFRHDAATGHTIHRLSKPL